MDRFIVKSLFYLTKFFKDLKSNMDRFIEQFYCNGIHIHFEFKIQYGQIYSMLNMWKIQLFGHLKSNMDRFIAFGIDSYDISHLLFKIQYGQIYRKASRYCERLIFLFKIQYGQIYRLIHLVIHLSLLYLKSNMDRFIVQVSENKKGMLKKFKIQYGQIYRQVSENKKGMLKKFKIQYGQIYSNSEVIGESAVVDLKSNMDRFIVNLIAISLYTNLLFKIQYGQIYSCLQIIILKKEQHI